MMEEWGEGLWWRWRWRIHWRGEEERCMAGERPTNCKAGERADIEWKDRIPQT